MAIKLKTEEGTEFSFDTVAEFMEFKNKMDEEEASKELTSEPVEDTSDDEIEVPGTEPKFEAGDKVRVEVVEDGVHQYLLTGHFKKVEPLGKDANGEDLYAGDLVTGTEDNEYGYTNNTVDMEVIGRGRSIIDEEANIQVRIIGETNTYRVDSSKFVKLSDDLDEDEQEFKVGDKVRVVGNDYGHCMDLGELREIKEVDPNEPKYNLSGSSCGYWAGTSDIELVNSSPKFRTGDIVKVTESFSDILGGRVTCGDVYNYDENLGFGEPSVGSVFLGDNKDKIELVCRDEDRLDK